LNQEKADYDFREPENGKWVKSEKGAIKVLTFSDEISVPVNIPDGFSPHVLTAHNYKDREKYGRDEALRQQLVRKHFEYAERCSVHFERGNWKLFDKESPTHHGGPVTVKSRLIDLYNFYAGAFSKFGIDTDANRHRIRQRLTYAKTCDASLVDELAKAYLSSGKMLKLWKEIHAVRRAFVSRYNFLQPLFQIYYWLEELQDLSRFKLSDKKFDELRQLYIDCFETLCRLLVIGMGFEMIIDHRSLNVPTKKGSMSLEQFEQLPNAAKREHLEKYPIEDIFVPVLDTEFRNGIGHHAAHYDAGKDEIVLYDTKDSGVVTRTIGYTGFCVLATTQK